MRFDTKRQTDFFAEMSERQISAREFFGSLLLDSISRNYGLDNGLIMCFDTRNRFLSWTDREGMQASSADHPYVAFQPDDIVRETIFREAVSSGLDYFNVDPMVYRSSDIVRGNDEASSELEQFTERHFGAAHSAVMAFGINAYIQIVFFKTRDEGDFKAQEMETLSDIYIAIANAYKGFKKYEQSRIVSHIQDQVIRSGEKAYFITDDFMHVLSCNSLASTYITNMLGEDAAASLNGDSPCLWLPFLLEGDGGGEEHREKTVRGYVFGIYTYDREYSHGIVDRYHWITIYPEAEAAKADGAANDMGLTPGEKRVAELLLKGLTYREIAARLYLSYHTVKKHVENIYARCGVNSRYELYELKRTGRLDI